ncbi:hypothetical protein IFM89_016541 [Coptis chinensis]|uniref:Uncharacterized protein n=1 Tax=Coptis chinensis TaxID=261450 RepID=A0A835IRR9_9MAGN|nr:hypothetical protein IFM89_016541 [Coptis chinensis]
MGWEEKQMVSRWQFFTRWRWGDQPGPGNPLTPTSYLKRYILRLGTDKHTMGELRHDGVGRETNASGIEGVDSVNSSDGSMKQNGSDYGGYGGLGRNSDVMILRDKEKPPWYCANLKASIKGLMSAMSPTAAMLTLPYNCKSIQESPSFKINLEGKWFLGFFKQPQTETKCNISTKQPTHSHPFSNVEERSDEAIELNCWSS